MNVNIHPTGYKVTAFDTWVNLCLAEDDRSPGWLRELGFMPLYLLLVPVATSMMFLFEWYWGF